MHRARPASASPPSLALTHATVVSTYDHRVLEDHTLVVRGSRIAAVTPSAEGHPADATVIDARGWFLIPGLSDMHVHLLPVDVGPEHSASNEDEALDRGADCLRVFLAHGITCVRNMAGTPFHLRLRQAVRDGRIVGPRIYTAGPILESRFSFPQLAQFGELVTTPDEARASVVAQHAAGYDFIKVYNDIDPDVYDEIIRVSRERGLKIVGHVPYAKGLQGALAARQDSIEHFRAYDFALDTRPDAPAARFSGWLHTDAVRMREVAERTAEAGSWNVPTLVVERAIASPGKPTTLPDWLPPWLRHALETDDTRDLVPPAYIELIRGGLHRRLEMVSALERAGAPLLAGSDCPGCALVPGLSLHEELSLFVEAGLSPLRALRAATSDAAAFLGISHEVGALRSGMRADVVAVGADPRSSIDALRDIRGVMANGSWYPTASLIRSHAHNTEDPVETLP
jgi:imidazolonepropionase-like amidohydrolase